MSVVKSIVSKNEFYAVQKAVIPVASEAIADHIMYVQSQLKSEFIEKLRVLDLEPIIFLLTHPKKSLGWSRDKALQAIAHYRMFLLLHYLYPDKNLVPTVEIDMVWEQHSLDHAKYRQDCNSLFDSFVDHNPYRGLLDETDEKNWLADFEETKILFEQNFGTDFLSAINLQLTDPAHCELPKKSKPIPTRMVNMQANIMNISPWNLMKCG